MAIIYRAKEATRNKLNTLESIIDKQLIVKKGMSMMYIAIAGERRFKTRGEHSAEVAEIAAELARKLGGDAKKALQIGKAHDFGHTLLAHTGEIGIGNFLASPDDYLEDDNINARDMFDHSKHGAKIFKITCARIGIKAPEYLINGIESHSTGSSSTGAIKCESFEAECVMRADKIASSISDTQDMLRAGVFDLSDESLSSVFDNNEKIREIMSKRLFKDYKKSDKDFDNMLEFAIRLNDDRSVELKKLKDNPKPGNKYKVFKILDDVKNEQIDRYIEKIKNFIKLPAQEQKSRLINLIVDGVENSRRSIDVSLTDEYSKKYPNGQLYVTWEAEAILAGLRGLLVSMEDKRLLGKTGPELEGLVENVARYVYKHKSDFENNKPFKNWRRDENNNKIEWKYQVIYGLAQMTDENFKKFVMNLQENEEAREVLKNCKYRDPRDLEYMKKHPGIKLPFSSYDFSTKESINNIWNVDVAREYQPPMYEQIGIVSDYEKNMEENKNRSIEIVR